MYFIKFKDKNETKLTICYTDRELLFLISNFVILELKRLENFVDIDSLMDKGEDNLELGII